jgi:Putative zinc-finger
MHLDDERVQRLLDGELSPSEERAAREHVVDCADCRQLLGAAERDHANARDLLARLDPPPASAGKPSQPEPAIDFISILEEVRRRGHAERRARRRPLQWAAGFLLVAGLAGLAYAIPGSPVRAWIDRLVARVGGGANQAPSNQESSGGAGIAVAPGDRLVVLFQSAQALGVARVSWTAGAEVVVRSSSPRHTFTSDAEVIMVANHGSQDDFEIEIPRAAPRVEIQVGGTRVFMEEGGRVTSHSGTVSGDVYEIPLSR